MKSLQELQEGLNQFTGAIVWYQPLLYPHFLYSKGIRYLATNADCFWLLDFIFSNQILSQLKTQPFQVWKIIVNEDDSAKLIVEDGNDNQVTSFHVNYTDFPINEFSLWMVDNVLILPSEY